MPTACLNNNVLKVSDLKSEGMGSVPRSTVGSITSSLRRRLSAFPVKVLLATLACLNLYITAYILSYMMIYANLQLWFVTFIIHLFNTVVAR